jgi:hypothetical protein
MSNWDFGYDPYDPRDAPYPLTYERDDFDGRPAGPTEGPAGRWQAGEEPWLDDARGARLDGPWWDPDSWPDWRRWLIPVGVAVLAAAIGAALVLLTGMHAGASAAVGQTNPTTSAGPAA